MKKHVAGEDGRFVRRLIDCTLIRAIAYLRRRTEHYHVLEELTRRTAADQADFIEKNMMGALAIESRPRLWDYALSKVSLDGLYAEFGVFNGSSINYLARKASAIRKRPIVVYGFDSFIGLQEDWSGSEHGRGAFSLGGKLPKVDRNVTLVKGWFNETLPAFLEKNPGPAAFLHIDSDTYEAAHTLFSLLKDRIVPGTIIVMDDYFGYRGWRDNEHKAWNEFVASSGITFEYLAFGIWPVAVRILGTTSRAAPSAEASAVS